MGSIRGLVGRHRGTLLAVLTSAFFVPSRPPRLDRPRVVLPAHEARIVEFSPDRRTMATDDDPGVDSTVELWDVPTLRGPAETGPTVLAMVSAALVLVTGIDRRRAHRAAMDDAA